MDFVAMQSLKPNTKSKTLLKHATDPPILLLEIQQLWETVKTLNSQDSLWITPLTSSAFFIVGVVIILHFGHNIVPLLLCEQVIL